MDQIKLTEKLKSFLDEEGRLRQWPSKRKKQLLALFYLASKFEQGVIYTEKEVNELLEQWHSFEDWSLMRRELFDGGFLGREPSGAAYWLEENQPMPEGLGF